MATYNRGKLLRLAKEGKLVCVKSYSFDDGHGATNSIKELPVRVIDNTGEWKEGVCNLRESHFKGNSGCAYTQANGTVCLVVHSNLNFDFKIIGK